MDIKENDSIIKLLQSTLFLPKLKFLEYERMVPLFQKRPVQPKICFNNVTKYQFVEFDTETTPLGKDAEICQIAAITKGGNTYKNHIFPTCSISHYASRVNKLTFKITNGQRTLFKENSPVKSVPLSECLVNFLHFLSSVGPSSTTRHTVLIGHNPSVFIHSHAITMCWAGF